MLAESYRFVLTIKKVEPMDAERKKILYHACHRGTKEADFVIGRFVTSYLPSCDHGQMQVLEQFLACDDILIFSMLSEQVVPSHLYQPIVTAMRCWVQDQQPAQ